MMVNQILSRPLLADAAAPSMRRIAENACEQPFPGILGLRMDHSTCRRLREIVANPGLIPNKQAGASA